MAYTCRKEAARRFTPPKPTTKSEIRAGQVQYRADRAETPKDFDDSDTLDAKAMLEMGRKMMGQDLKQEKDVEKKQAGAETREDILKRDDHSRDFNSEED